MIDDPGIITLIVIVSLLTGSGPTVVGPEGLLSLENQDQVVEMDGDAVRLRGANTVRDEFGSLSLIFHPMGAPLPPVGRLGPLMGREILRDGEVIAGGVLAALGVYIFFQALTWDYYTADGPGPGFFPFWYGVAMVVLSLALIVGRIRKASTSDGPDWRAGGRALATWFAFALSVALMVPLGFLMSFALLTFFLVVVVFGRSPLTGLATGVGLAIGFYLVFPLALSLPLPTGFLGF